MPTAPSWSNGEMSAHKGSWIPLPLSLAIVVLVSACAVTHEEVTPTNEGLYRTAAWHIILAETAVDRTADDAEAFCAQTEKAMSVRDMKINRRLSGVYVRRWFKCVEP